MSLILEALKKLERERDTPHRGFLVLGPVAWPEPGRTRAWSAAAVAVVVAAVAVAALLRWAWPIGGAPASRTEAAPVAAPANPRPAAPAGTPRELAVSPTTRTLAPPAQRDRVFPGGPSRTPDLAGQARSVAPDTPSRPPAPPSGAADRTATVQHLAEEDAKPEAADTDARDADAAEFRLTAISQRDGRPIAVLNDRFVHEGDVFEGVRVLRIGDDEVEIEVGGQRQVVRF